MRCDVVAVGTELLLGQIVDTNSAWLGEHLAAIGIDSLLQVKVGDNLGRVVTALRSTLATADAVIVCGGLGPTHDDLTREAIAEIGGHGAIGAAGIHEVTHRACEGGFVRSGATLGDGVRQSASAGGEPHRMVERRPVRAQRIDERGMLAVAVDDDASTLAIDLHAVGLERRQRHEQIRGAAVRELQQQKRRVVLGVVGADAGEYALDLSAGEKANQVDVMRAEIEKHTATGLAQLFPPR